MTQRRKCVRRSESEIAEIFREYERSELTARAFRRDPRYSDWRKGRSFWLGHRARGASRIARLVVPRANHGLRRSSSSESGRR